MQAKLTEIKLDSSNVYTTEELDRLLKYYHKAQFKTLEDFKSWDFKDKTEEQQKEIINKYEEYSNNPKKSLSGYDHTFVCDLHIFMHDFPHIKFSVLGTRDVNIDITNSDAVKLQQDVINNMLKQQETKMVTMMETFIKMSERIAENLSVDTLNQKCDVHIGGGLLMTVNETLLLEDSCTDRLQTELNSGWRILAVCIQPDGRRPDYVLGRYNPNLQIYGEAGR